MGIRYIHDGPERNKKQNSGEDIHNKVPRVIAIVYLGFGGFPLTGGALLPL